jgi:hypothetical protein
LGAGEHLLNPLLPNVFGTGVLEVARKRGDAWVRLGALPIVIGACAGVGWTLGPDHVTSAVGGLVWVAIAVTIATSPDVRMTKTRTLGADEG